MTFLQLAGVQKSFGASAVVKAFDLSVGKGEFVTFLGPSGCGKTTTLRMIAGFEAPSAGTILIDGKDVTDVRTAKRNIGMVFQSYALFPNMSVAGNVGFGLRVAGKSAVEIKARVDEMLDLIKLPHLAERYPRQLSGGQQQRVSLARALAPSPQILLLDEPLSALDARIRVALREEIRSLQRKLGITTIFVTHDQEEALSMSDRIVVMNDGHIEQVGSPRDIYNRPRTRFVASFVGTLNALQGEVIDGASGVMLIEGQSVIARNGLAGAPKGAMRAVALRPEALRRGAGGPGRNILQGSVEDAAFLGSVIRIKLRLAQSAIVFDSFNSGADVAPERGERLSVNFAPEDLIVLAEA